MNKDVAVLLATFNGEKYLEEQLQSLFNQKMMPNKLIISDDFSTDSTWHILQNWKSRHPEIIELHKNNTSRHGHVGNFAHLCEIAKQTQCEYFLFCDQDDVWSPNKIDDLIQHCTALESQIGRVPLLMHSDLAVVDEKLNMISPSFFAHQKLPNPNLHSMPKFLIQNVVTGCTTLINRALLSKATPIPNEVIVHDWWFAIIAHLEGIIGFIDKPLVEYRQHSYNSIGAVKKQNILKRHLKAFQTLRLSLDQAEALYPYCSGENTLKIKQFIFFYKLPLGERNKLVKELVNNPDCIIEKSLLFIALQILSFVRKNGVK